MQHKLDDNRQLNIAACAIIDHIPDIFLLVDSEGCIVMVNAVIEQILGWKQSEVLGLQIEVLIPPEFRKSHHHQRSELFMNRGARDMNQRLNLFAWHKLGYSVPIDIKLSFTEIDGDCYGIAIIRDATNQRELQNQLKEKNEKLKQLLVEKNNMLGMAVHDMRNPIGMVQNFSQILLANSIGPLNEDQTEFIKRMYQLSQFMMGLLEDLLDMSSIESGTMNLHKEEFLINELLNEILLSNKVHAWEKDIQLVVNKHPDESVTISADKRKLNQVMHNLVDNAIKYSPKDTEVIVNCTVVNNMLTFTVADQGVGISKADQENLFKPFFRAQNKPTGGEKSTGLGLFISKRIAEAHQGKLSVKSENGKGSTFTLSIPLKE